jgi:hypothetical protein
MNDELLRLRLLQFLTDALPRFPHLYNDTYSHLLFRHSSLDIRKTTTTHHSAYSQMATTVGPVIPQHATAFDAVRKSAQAARPASPPIKSVSHHPSDMSGIQ